MLKEYPRAFKFKEINVNAYVWSLYNNYRSLSWQVMHVVIVTSPSILLLLPMHFETTSKFPWAKRNYKFYCSTLHND